MAAPSPDQSAVTMLAEAVVILLPRSVAREGRALETEQHSQQRWQVFLLEWLIWAYAVTGGLYDFRAVLASAADAKIAGEGTSSGGLCHKPPFWLSLRAC